MFLSSNILRKQSDKTTINDKSFGPEFSNFQISWLQKNCDYVDMLDDLIRDQERIQQRLLSEGSVLTLKKALDASLALESAIKQSNFQKTVVIT